VIKRLFHGMFESAMHLNKENILGLLDPNPTALLLDLGCDDGQWTAELARQIGTCRIYGIDIVEDRLAQARGKGIIGLRADLNGSLPMEDSSVDIAHANQVIEHIADLDRFLSEIHRILKVGGYVVISTENGSSWHNIFAAILGWQMFSLTNVSARRAGIGNPLAIHRDKESCLDSWTHKTIFNYRGLREIFETYGFRVVAIKGSGYYPFPSVVGRWDPRHSHFLTVRAEKQHD